MRPSLWIPRAVLALAMPSAAVAADEPLLTYTPATIELPRPPPPKPTLVWKYTKEWKGYTEFRYNISTASDTNWIGMFYAFAGLPVNGTKVGDPLLWEYAPKTEGVVRLDTKNFETRAYKAYFFANGTYEPIVDPVDFSVGKSDVVRHYSHIMTLRPARQGEYWTYDIAGMINLVGDDKNIYYLIYVNGDEWISSTVHGVLHGTPTKRSSRVTHLATKVETRRGLTSYLELIVHVSKPDEPLVKELKVMNWNMWQGGTLLNRYHANQLFMVTRYDLDIIALQEAGALHGRRLAHSLGWWAYETPNASIISKFPIVEVYNATAEAAAVRIALDGDKQQVVFWAASLSPEQYGPYGFCFEGQDRDAVLAGEDASRRAAQAEALGAAVKPYVDNADSVPVIVAGGFNAPSHLDYTAATADLHCGAGEVPWPASRHMAAAGLTDSFREAHPDPLADPGATWGAPVRLVNPDHGNKTEPQDRIDFVYYAGPMRVLKSESLVRIFPGLHPWPDPKFKTNEWPSDHHAVVTTFNFTGVKPKRDLQAGNEALQVDIEVPRADSNKALQVDSEHPQADSED